MRKANELYHDINIEIAERLSDYAKEKGVSMGQLSKQLGYSRTYIYQILRGKRNFSMKAFCELMEKSKINEELLTLQAKMRLANAQKYFRDNGCIWYIDGLFNPRGKNFQQMCSWAFMPTDTKCQYYDVDHNPINHDYYDHPIYKSQKWSKPMDTITV